MGSGPKTFAALGERIDRAWRARGYEEQVFPEIATSALRQSNPSRWARPEEILREFLTASTRPAQHKIPFGSPSVVVYHGHHFFIEMLCWSTASMAIHRHGFSGAFHVLRGSSLQSIFDFEVVRRVNSRFLIGNLVRTSTELLETGATQPIHAVKFIHSAFHLDTPSITVVVRTRFEAEARPQYIYKPPHLAIDPLYDDAVALRQLETLAFLAEVRLGGYRQAFAEYVTGGDLQACYEGLRIAFANEAFFAELLPVARKAHGPLVDLFVSVLHELHRRNTLILKRQRIKDADHRFFLGMLLNLERREDILRMVRARYGAPAATILRWVRELALVASGDPAFDIKLTPTETAVFRCLLHGRSLPETLRELGRQPGPSAVRPQRSAIEDCYEALRTHEVYQPLFRHEAPPRPRSKR